MDDQDSGWLLDRELFPCVDLTFAFFTVILVPTLQEFRFAELLQTLLKGVTLVDLLQSENHLLKTG